MIALFFRISDFVRACGEPINRYSPGALVLELIYDRRGTRKLSRFASHAASSGNSLSYPSTG